MLLRTIGLAITAAISLISAGSALAQVSTNVPAPVAGAKQVTLRWVKVHSPAIEGSLEGDSADRDVLVVLPPSYATSPTRRYPVVYALHGYRSAPRSGSTKSMSRRPSKAPSPRARAR